MSYFLVKKIAGPKPAPSLIRNDPAARKHSEPRRGKPATKGMKECAKSPGRKVLRVRFVPLADRDTCHKPSPGGESFEPGPCLTAGFAVTWETRHGPPSVQGGPRLKYPD
jgi:hypothetical protein